METGIDLRTADRDTLIALIVQQRDLIIRQQAIIESLEKRVAQLEGQAKSKGSGRMAGLKPKEDGKPTRTGNRVSVVPRALPGSA